MPRFPLLSHPRLRAQIVARQQAVNKVSDALDHQDRKTDRLNDRVDLAADRAAAKQVQASQVRERERP